MVARNYLNYVPDSLILLGTTVGCYLYPEALSIYLFVGLMISIAKEPNFMDRYANKPDENILFESDVSDVEDEITTDDDSDDVSDEVNEYLSDISELRKEIYEMKSKIAEYRKEGYSLIKAIRDEKNLFEKKTE